MKANYFTGSGGFALRDTDLPSPGPGEVVIKNMACGVCGTDVHIANGEPGSAEVTPPVVLGHEYAGEVTAIGEGVTQLHIGDKVTVDPNIYCGCCEYCRNGKKQLCPSMQAVGVTRNGGFAQYSLAPAAQAFLLAPHVSYEAGAMAEPVACCLHGIDLAGIQPGQRVCVVGGGAIGLIMLQLAKLSGAAALMLSEPDPARREAALALDPRDRAAYGEQAGCADVVIECVGNNPAVESAFHFADKGATVVLFSVPKPDAEYPLPLFDVYKKELTIKGSFVNPDTHSRAAALLASGRLRLKELITHRFPVDRLREAIETQAGPESIKVLVVPEEE